MTAEWAMGGPLHGCDHRGYERLHRCAIEEFIAPNLIGMEIDNLDGMMKSFTAVVKNIGQGGGGYGAL